MQTITDNQAREILELNGVIGANAPDLPDFRHLCDAYLWLNDRLSGVRIDVLGDLAQYLIARQNARRSTSPVFDQIDQDRLDIFKAAWAKISGPRVGDFARMPDGELRRFTHAYDDGLQTTYPEISGDGSFYFGMNGASYSGALDSIIPLERINPTNETAEGRFWFFHHQSARAHNGVNFTIPCRVFNIRAERVATNRPGDQAAIVAEETGMSYSDALVFCNMD